MKIWTQFPYADCCYSYEPGKMTKWKRVLVKDVDKEARAPSNNQNCFCTVQKYRDAVQDKVNPQVHYCGLFFDLDADPEIYGSEEAAISVARAEAKRVIQFFKHKEVEEPHIRVWYSGSKGFHILVMPESLDIKPSRYLTYMMKLAVLHVAKTLDLKTLDMTVYSKGRQWRLPNSIHQSSGRFKVELYHQELDLSHKKLCELATRARDPLYDSLEYESIKPTDDGSEWWLRFVKEYERQEELRNLEPTKHVVKTEKWPACVTDIMSGGLKVQGTRNRATMALASYFKDVGYDEAACEKLILGWLDEKIPEVPSKTLERIGNTRAVVRSVYEGDQHHFSCAFIRSLSHGANRVKCTAPKCDTIENEPENQRPAKVPRVPLSKASESVYLSKTVNIPVMITGKADSPYAYPKKVIFFCHPDLESQLCQGCRISDKEGHAEVTFDVRNQTLIDLVNCTDQRRNAVIKRYAGVPHKCYSNRIEITEHGNLEEVRLQPNVINGHYDSRLQPKSEHIEEGNYCTRLAYYVGHGIEINKKYDITASVWGHPRDQKICHIFDDAEASQDDIDKFKMTPQIFSMLSKFQPAQGQSVVSKFKEIHDDLENNVHMIWGRREVAIAFDLVYHSVLSFTFQSVFEKKGWMELLVIGDSGNGKTKLIERVMRHYQLGEITGVEGGKRTGLIWANHNIGGRFMLVWGKIPQNDRRLIVLDEFSGMPDEEVAQMTRLRTEGIAESQGINPAQTNARTRMVFLSNAKNGRPLDSYNYGIESIDKLFKEHQDVRRLDLAVCVKSGDIPLEVINKKHIPDPNSHNYDTDMCKKLVLWAWSRDPSQIRFSVEAEAAILENAIKLGKKYRCDITLVEPSDQRLKLARAACAVAARMFSTDGNGELLLVGKEHVDFATAFIQRCYDHPAMEYDVYADTRQTRMYMSEEKRLELKGYWSKLKNHAHLRNILLSGSYFRKGELQDQTGYEKEEINQLLKKLSQNFLITSTAAGYRKTPMFTSFLKDFDKIGSTDPGF